jgi:hypothetical protein
VKYQKYVDHKVSVFPKKKTADNGLTGNDFEHPSDASLQGDMLLDHAPANANGTYLMGMNDDLERLEEYRRGSCHPILVGDILGASGQYHVLHRVGY